MKASMKQKLRGNKGFTLIEVIIVLLIIGLIIGVSVGLFTNPIKTSSIQQAALKIADDLRVMDDGAQKFLTDKTTEIDPLTDLTDEAYLKSIPVPPSQAKDSGFGGAYAYAKDGATYTGWGTVAADYVYVLDGITTDVCKKVNELFTGAAPGAAPPVAVNTGKDLQCFGAAAPYTIVKPVYIH